jgi:glyoxylase-like metal-dependent hydrolase (beta-lactamase superfamily II)
MTGLVHQAQLGDAEIVQILDTTLDLPARDVFPDLANEGGEPLGPLGEDGAIAMPVLVYAVRIDGHTTLIDTGVGDPPEAGGHPGQLLPGLAQAGISTDDIDTVVFTHLHPDHIGGGVDSSGEPTFRRARYVVTAVEWIFWAQPVWREQPREWLGASFERRLDPLDAAGALERLDGPGKLARRLRVRNLPGHTPGQIGVEADTGNGSLLFIGDALHHPAQWLRPRLRWRDDADPTRASAERERLGRELSHGDTVVASAHFPLPGVGRVATSEGLLTWKPIHLEDLSST